MSPSPVPGSPDVDPTLSSDIISEPKANVAIASQLVGATFAWHIDGAEQGGDKEVQKIIGGSHEEAKRLLTAHRKQLDVLAEALVERETLNEQEILEAMGPSPAPPLETRRLPVHGVNGGNANTSREAPGR